MAFKLKIKNGTSIPGTGVLDTAELGYQSNTKIVYVGNGVGNDPTPVIMAIDTDGTYKRIANLDGAQFNTAAVLAQAEGLVKWDATHGTFAFGVGQSLDILAGEDLLYYGKASGNISKGNAVQYAGFQGDHILMKAAVPSEVNANPTLFMGLATSDITDGSFGYVITFGHLHDVDTTPLGAAGNILWFASAGSTAGALTTTEPTGANARIQVAAIIKEENSDPANNGVLQVRVTINPRLIDIQGVSISSAANGDVLKYDGTNWVNTNQLHIATNGNVGIGETNPTNKLVVAGSVNLLNTQNANIGLLFTTGGVSTSLYKNDADDSLRYYSTSGGVGADRVTILPNGRIGIGSTQPSMKLEVFGSNDAGLKVRNTSPGSSSTPVNTDISIGGYGSNETILRTIDTSSSFIGNQFAILTRGSDNVTSEKFRIDRAGRVGIGTSSPSDLLHITSISGANSRLRLTQTDFQSYSLGVPLSSTSFTIKNETTTLTPFTITTDGNVGIGISTPAEKLDVIGKIKTSSQFLASAPASNSISVGPSLYLDGQLNGAFNIIQSGTDRLSFWNYYNNWRENIVFTRDGNIGIGTTTPSQKLEIADVTLPTIRLTNLDTSISEDQELGRLEFYNSDSSGNGPKVEGRISVLGGDSFGIGGKMTFAVGASGTGNEGAEPVERMRIDLSGNVGIGTITPAERLDVNGTILAKNNIVAGDGIGSSDVLVELGRNRTADGYAYVDLVGDTTYTDFGMRLIRHNTGANANSEITHRGTGALQFVAIESAPILFYNSGGSERLKINSEGLVGINETTPTAQLDVKSGAIDRIGLVVDTPLGQTANIAEFQTNGSIRALIGSNGRIVTNVGVTNLDGGSSFAYVNTSNTGTIISRNVGDTNPALRVNQVHASSTGDLLQLEKEGVDIYAFTHDGTLKAPATFTIDPSAHGDATGKVIILGDLQVDGTTTTINSTVLDVNDKNITLSKGAANKAASDGAGIDIDLGTDGTASFTYGATPNRFAINKGLDIFGIANFTGGYLIDSLYNLRINTQQNQPFTISHAGTENFRITSTGNVGIGTAVPQNKLSIISESNTDGLQIRRNSANTNDYGTIGFRINTTEGTTNYAEIRGVRTNRVAGGDSDLRFATWSNGTISEKLIIRDDGRVGIGTTTPDNLLHIKGNGASVNIDRNTDSYGASLLLSENGTKKWEIKDDFDGSNENRLQIASADNVVRMTVLQGGNVGIGTNTPKGKLDVIGSRTIGTNIPSNWAITSAGRFGVTDGDKSFYLDIMGSYAEFSTYNYSTNTAFPMVFNANGGNVGIGTSSPLQKLDVVGNVKADGFIVGSSLQRSETVTTTSTTQTALASFAAASYGTGKFLIQATQGSIRQVSELLVVHDGTTAYATEYAVIKTGADLFTTEVDISSGNVRVLITSASATSTVYKTSFTLIGA